MEKKPAHGIFPKVKGWVSHMYLRAISMEFNMENFTKGKKLSEKK